MLETYVDEVTPAVAKVLARVSRNVGRPIGPNHRRVASSGTRLDIDFELDLARAVQRQLLPQNPKSLSTIRFTGASVPAGPIGGDYYDFLDLGPQSLGVVVADVSGKGIAAALLVANLQASVRTECARGFRDLPGMLERIHARFFESTLPGQYATTFFGQYDNSTRRLRYVNCGQQPAILMRRNGCLERLWATAPPLGLVDRWSGEEEAVELRPGDTLCVCSDGVFEAGIDTGAEFGEQGLVAVLHDCKYLDIQSTVDCVVDETRNHDPYGAADDVTVVGIRAV